MPGSLRITWHDPCHLKLGLGVTQAPREIITGLSGVEYAEALESSCCGGAVSSACHITSWRSR
ncbi:MAG: hypothetical protein HZB44_01875 [Actinobacteria bacterium]|nr:hypothetical protein [Actinomycetota bacterium]